MAAKGNNGFLPLLKIVLACVVTALVYFKRFSAAFQLMTSQMALKYSALRFWYWRL
jgi:hypothetical protein